MLGGQLLTLRGQASLRLILQKLNSVVVNIGQPKDISRHQDTPQVHMTRVQRANGSLPHRLAIKLLSVFLNFHLSLPQPLEHATIMLKSAKSHLVALYWLKSVEILCPMKWQHLLHIFFT